MTLILQKSIALNRDDKDDNFGKTISIVTTVQKKNITYPTDDKLYKKIIVKCVSIAKQAGLVLKQTYGKELKRLGLQQRFKKRKNGYKIARKSNKRVKTIAGRLVRDVEQKLTPERLVGHATHLLLYKKVLTQQQSKKTNTSKEQELNQSLDI